MRAIVIARHGGPEVLEERTLPDPVPEPGQVLVRVRAVSLNRLDLYTRAGARGTRLPPEHFPHVLGGDCAGDVMALGEGVTSVRAGQRVVVNPYLGEQDGAPRMLGTHCQGAYAELVAVPAANVVRLPEALTHDDAAALPTVYLPAWAIIVREGKLRPGQTALVLSASGGVGTAAVQMVNHAGATCIATTSTEAKANALRTLGAADVINYATQDVAQRVREFTRGRGVELVVDSVGGQAFQTAFSLLAPHGRYGVCGMTAGYEATLHLGNLFVKQAHVFGVFMGSTAELRRIVSFAARGALRPVVHARYPLAQARAAHEAMERAEHIGKLILTVE